MGNSVVVQWLGFLAFTARGPNLISTQGTKIPQAVQSSRRKKRERSYFGWSYLVFPDSSVCKESACTAGDPSSISGLGRSPGEGIGFPLQCSWVSLMAQLVKNPLVVWETWVRSLRWEDPPKKGKATHSNILAWRIPGLQRVGHSSVTFTASQSMTKEARLHNVGKTVSSINVLGKLDSYM